MTTSPAELVADHPRTMRSLLSRLAEPVLAAAAFALLAGAWLAFFVFVPFDFMPPRP